MRKKLAMILGAMALFVWPVAGQTGNGSKSAPQEQRDNSAGRTAVTERGRGGRGGGPGDSRVDRGKRGGGGGGEKRGQDGGGGGTRTAPQPSDWSPETIALGCATDKSITAATLSDKDLEAYFEYGTRPGNYTGRTQSTMAKAMQPFQVIMDGLQANTRYYYRIRYRAPGAGPFTEGKEHTFHTQRPPGSAFTFCIQGDSHPERGSQFTPELYARTLGAASGDHPDFYMTIGDDFSVDNLQVVNPDTVAARYILQRSFLAQVANSASLYLVNGNHEQATRHLLDGTPNNVAVWAQNSRNRYFAQPAPDGFYTGDTEVVEHIGLLRDYYAWTWGDALFVTIDPYWHSSVPVDNKYGGGSKTRNRWDITIGDAQCQWLKTTLEQSKAKYKFVFAHHVMGTGRGGIDIADQYEWGGKNPDGTWGFTANRPGWPLPIHQLMAANHVTIFFQGHDHIFVRQELDGVVYQELPEPGDPSYTPWNETAYTSGVKIPNTGYVRVAVSPANTKVEYVHVFLPKDESTTQTTGQVAYSYTISASGAAPTATKSSSGVGSPKGSDAAENAKESPKAPERDAMPKSVVASGAKIETLGAEFQFTEGPTVNARGDVFFSDVRANRTYQWRGSGEFSVVRENTHGANGLYFDANGNLLACEGDAHRVVSIDPQGAVQVLADQYNGVPLNKPNDLWIDPKGGVYFTDPVYGGRLVQDGEHVYYITPDRKRIIRVISDMVRPNGLVGTPDGNILYVSDHGAKQIYTYHIKDDGTLANKTLFVSVGSDGMTIDSEGNIYLTERGVLVFDPAGNPIDKIDVPVQPTNLCFVGKDHRTLLITARTSVYAIECRIPGIGKFQGAAARRGADAKPVAGRSEPSVSESKSNRTFDPSTYVDNGDGTVTDNATSLMWQQVDGGEMTWEQAAAYAKGLTLAGHNDWRLPTPGELFDIMDHESRPPAIDTKTFPRTDAEYWWTNAALAGDPSRVWVVNAGGGAGAHPKKESQSAGGGKLIHTRCVRDTPASKARAITGPRFRANGDGTATDNATGLTWQQDEAAPMTWEAALAYADGLSLAGHDDWRLPNVKELQSINDETRINPSLDTRFFPKASASRHWSSTTLAGPEDRAWFVEFRYGLVSYDQKTAELGVRCVRGGGDPSAAAASQSSAASAKPTVAAPAPEGMVLIPSGSFEMGDHHNFVDPGHPSDEIPIHTVRLDAFYMGIHDVTNRQYCEYLNSALAQHLIEMKDARVYPAGQNDLLCETRAAVPYTRIGWDGRSFSVLDQRENHPVVCVRWEGAVSYCNWLTAQMGLQPCYDVKTWACDFSKNAVRLPTEAEWEYAGRGGHFSPYYIYPWADDTNNTKANWPDSGDPFEAGPDPWTTPVGFYNGQIHRKEECNWPGDAATYQTGNGANGFGLYDMAGNVWQWCNDWYVRDYYSFTADHNPPGPEAGSPMPDGKPYHVLRGGNWFNGPQGHSRVANRDPAYFRGPQDPNHPYYHVGFRVVMDDPSDGPRSSGTNAQAPREGRRMGPEEGQRPPRPGERGPGMGERPRGGGQGGPRPNAGERRGGNSSGADQQTRG